MHSWVFIFVLMKMLQSEASPLFSVDPTHLKVRVLEGFPQDCGSCILQDGKVIQNNYINEDSIPQDLPYCEVNTDINRTEWSGKGEIYPGRRLRVRKIEGSEYLIRKKKKVEERFWFTYIDTGISPNLEWSFRCYAPKNQTSELTVKQLQDTTRGLLEWMDIKLLPFDLDTTHTFNQKVLPGTKIRFHKNLNSSPYSSIYFQNGKTIERWEKGPYCQTWGASWGHKIPENAVYPITDLTFTYDHGAGLEYNTSTHYLIELEGADFHMNYSSNNDKNIFEKAFKRPLYSDFQKAVGNLISLEF